MNHGDSTDDRGSPAGRGRPRFRLDQRPGLRAGRAPDAALVVDRVPDLRLRSVCSGGTRPSTSFSTGLGVWGMNQTVGWGVRPSPRSCSGSGSATRGR